MTPFDRIRRQVGNLLGTAERTLRSARWSVQPPRVTELGMDAPRPLPSSAPSGQLTKRHRNTDSYNSHPSNGMQIEQLVSIFRTAEMGTPWRQFDLFDDNVEADGHLRGLVEGRNLSVAGKSWVLIPGAPDEGSRRASLDLDGRLRNSLDFRDFLEHQLTAPHYGVAASEVVWDLFDRLVMPSRFVNLAHRRLAAVSSEEIDRIALIVGDPGDLKMLALDTYPGRFATTVARHRNPWAAGSLRTASWWALFKRWSVRDWQIFAQMFGLPLRVGYYEEGASEVSREQLENALRAIGEDGVAILSNLTEIVIKDTARSGDAKGVYDGIAAMCNAEMSKLLAGATLGVDSGGPGSFALGAVHENRGFERAQSDATRVEEMFVRDIATPFVAWNGGYGGAKPPRLKMQIVRETGLLDRATHIEKLAATFPDFEFDQDQIREDFSFRKPAPGSAITGPKPPAPPALPGAKPPAKGAPDAK